MQNDHAKRDRLNQRDDKIESLERQLAEEVSRRYQAECNYDHAVVDRNSLAAQLAATQEELEKAQQYAYENSTSKEDCKRAIEMVKEDALKEVEQLRKDLDAERKINAMLGEWIDDEEMDLLDVCPEWCECCGDNPCSFQLELNARKQIQEPKEVEEWLKSVNCPDCKVRDACNPLGGKCPCGKEE